MRENKAQQRQNKELGREEDNQGCGVRCGVKSAQLGFPRRPCAKVSEKEDHRKDLGFDDFYI